MVEQDSLGVVKGLTIVVLTHLRRKEQKLFLSIEDIILIREDKILELYYQRDKRRVFIIHKDVKVSVENLSEDIFFIIGRIKNVIRGKVF